MREILSKLTKYHQLIVRGFIFLCLIYVVIPALLQIFTDDKAAGFAYNLFSFPAFTLILFVLFAVFNRKILLEHHYIIKQKQSLLFFVCSVISFSFYYFTMFSLQYTTGNFHWLVLLSLLLYCTGIVCLALTIFGLSIFRKTYQSLFILVIITIIFFSLTYILNQLWGVLSLAAARIIYFFLRLISDTAVFSPGQGQPILGLESFSVEIGAPCSGVESLGLYICLFLLLVIYELNNLIWKRTAIVFLIGLMGTFLLNIFRITLLILIGTAYPDFALDLFHSHAGWLLFSAFMLVLLYFGYGWMKSKE